MRITEIDLPSRVRMPVGERAVQITVTRVEDIGQGMVNVFYRNSGIPYRVPAATVVKEL